MPWAGSSSSTRISSPINGIVSDKNSEAGDLASPGQVMLTLYDPGKMQIEAPVPVRLISKLALSQDIEVTLDYPRKTLAATVTEIVSEVDSTTRTQLVKAHLKGETRDILPGSFARLWVLEDPRRSICVPKTSVYEVGQLEFVHVVKGERILRRLVKTGPAAGGCVEVLSGLDDGEQILLTPVKED